MGLCAVALVGLAFLNLESPMAMVIALLVVVGSGFALFSSPNTNAVMSAVPRPDSGIAISFLSTMRNMGQLTSMAVMSIITSLLIGTTSYADTAPADIATVASTSFWVFAVLCAIGIFTSLARGRKPAEK